VELASDFTAPQDGTRPTLADYRLLYVAATRAKLVLDPYGSEVITDLLADAAEARS
jgi:ATP-dependent exoDNAse (exonuclease V) beta subunit